MTRQEIEDELREQLYTLLHATSAIQPKSDEEFICAALPNLVLWAFEFQNQAIEEAVAAERQAIAEEVHTFLGKLVAVEIESGGIYSCSESKNAVKEILRIINARSGHPTSKI